MLSSGCLALAVNFGSALSILILISALHCIQECIFRLCLYNISPCLRHAALVVQVFKFYMKSDASDYGEGVTLMRTTSRKRAHRTDSMQEAAELANDGADDGAGFEGRSTDGTTPFLPEGVSPGLTLPQLTTLCWDAIAISCGLH